MPLFPPSSPAIVIQLPSFTWGANSIAATADTRYLPPGFETGTAGTAAVGFVAPQAFTLRGLAVRHNAAVGNGALVNYRFSIAGVPTGPTVSLASGAIGVAANFALVIPVLAGQLVELLAVKPASIGAGGIITIASAYLGP